MGEAKVAKVADETGLRAAICPPNVKHLVHD
jgi:hypothetical protein